MHGKSMAILLFGLFVCVLGLACTKQLLAFYSVISLGIGFLTGLALKRSREMHDNLEFECDVCRQTFSSFYSAFSSQYRYKVFYLFLGKMHMGDVNICNGCLDAVKKSVLKGHIE